MEELSSQTETHYNEETLHNSENIDNIDNEPEAIVSKKQELYSSLIFSNGEFSSIKDGNETSNIDNENDDRDYLQILRENSGIYNFLEYSNTSFHQTLKVTQEVLKKQLIESKKIDKENNIDNETCEISREEFLLNNWTSEKYNEFIRSNEGLAIIEKELNYHIDFEKGGFSDSYKISAMNLSCKLQNAFKNKLERDYDLMIGIDNKILRQSENFIRRIDDIVGNFLIDGGSTDGYGLTSKLQELLDIIYNNDKTLELKNNTIFIEQIQQKLKKTIASYSLDMISYRDGIRTVKLSGNTKIDETSRLQLYSYLLIYGSLFEKEFGQKISGNEFEQYTVRLEGLLEGILKDLGYIDLTRTEFGRRIADNEKAKKDSQRKKDLERRKETARRNKAFQRNKTSLTQKEGTHDEHDNLDDKSGTRIAEELALGSKIHLDHETKGELSSKEIKEIGGKTINVLWNQILNKVNINKQIFYGFFDSEFKSVNFGAFEKFKNMYVERNHELSEEEKSKRLKDLEIIENSLYSFENLRNKNIENGKKEKVDKEEELFDSSKTHAIGSVIDNIQNIFDSECFNNFMGKDGTYLNGFSLDNKCPAEIDTNGNLILNGSINGCKLKIAYNIQSGDLFMNSFSKKRGNFIYINDPEPNVLIGNLGTFDSIRDNYDESNIDENKDDEDTNNIGEKKLIDKKSEHDFHHPHGDVSEKTQKDYKTPPSLNEESKAMRKYRRGKFDDKDDRLLEMQDKQDNIDFFRSELLHKNLDLIGEKVKLELEKHSALNITTSSFSNTFNLLDANAPESSNNILDFKNTEEDYSTYNVFNVFQNSSPSELLEFSRIMEDLCNNYIGISRGTNNMEHNKDISKESKIIYSSDNDKDSLTSTLKNCTENLLNERNYIKQNKNFQLGISKLILDNFIDGPGPDAHLDLKNMESFMKGLKLEISKKNLRLVESQERQKEEEEMNFDSSLNDFF